MTAYFTGPMSGELKKALEEAMKELENGKELTKKDNIEIVAVNRGLLKTSKKSRSGPRVRAKSKTKRL